jgi:ABC-2 type transport system ATP-binding protein
MASDSAETIISVRDLRKTYGARVALAGVSLEVSAGEIVALLGPNGGGKTTLFRILATLLRSDAGSAQIAGCDVNAEPAGARAALGVVFQSPSLDRKLTVMENLRHHGHLYGLRGNGLIEKSQYWLQRVGLTERAGDRVETLSGGLARRVEIAKGMLPGPRVLLLDEPSTGLDPAARRNLWEQLDGLRQRDGVTVLLTTHIMDEAQRCDRVIMLDRGRVVAAGTPGELTALVGGEVMTIVADEPAAAAERLHALVGHQPVLVNGGLHVEVPAAAALVPRVAGELSDVIRAITVGQPTLEDAFMHLTGRTFTSEDAE